MKHETRGIALVATTLGVFAVAGVAVWGWIAVGGASGPSLGLPAEAPNEWRALATRCEDREAAACHTLGSAVEAGAAGVEANARRARDLFALACAMGNATDCSKAAVAIALDPNATPAMRDEALALGLKGCDGGQVAGCNVAGLGLVKSGSRGDAARGLALLEKACDGGLPVACRNVGIVLLEGNSDIPADVEGALRRFEAGCAQRDEDSCKTIAQRNGLLAAKEHAEAIVRCITETPDACASLVSRGLEHYGPETLHKLADGLRAIGASARSYTVAPPVLVGHEGDTETYLATARFAIEGAPDLDMTFFLRAGGDAPPALDDLSWGRPARPYRTLTTVERVALVERTRVFLRCLVMASDQAACATPLFPSKEGLIDAENHAALEEALRTLAAAARRTHFVASDTVEPEARRNARYHHVDVRSDDGALRARFTFYSEDELPRLVRIEPEGELASADQTTPPAPRMDACTSGEQCHWLGFLYDGGLLGLPSSEILAREHLAAGCALGHVPSCARSARVLETHASLSAADAARHLADAATACDEGAAEGCRQLGLARLDGLHGTPRDAAAGRAFLESACSLGDAPSCTRLEREAH